jgi:lysozyme
MATAQQPVPKCDNGATASQKYCNYFYFYRNNGSYRDPRLVRAISLGATETTRSVAIILGVDKYPNAQDRDLQAAKVDFDKLKIFLRDVQHFDEIIVLENDDVTLSNINYFLQVYIPQVSHQYTKPRVLFTYSGHGVASGVQGTKGYMVLSQAKDENDVQNFLSLGQLGEYFRNLAPQTFQFLALINSCFGGDVFRGTAAGGNIFLTDRPAANAITAGAPDELVYSEGNEGQGSIFFEGVIEGIGTGRASASFTESDLSGKTITRKRDVVRLGDLLGYLTDNVQGLNNKTSKSYSVPWEGSVEPPELVSNGGFVFFPEQTAQIAAAFGPADAPSGAVSSVSFRPDLKIFNQPREYPVQGVDVSQYDGAVDWKELASGKLSSQNVSFAFARATMGAERTDETFQNNWPAIAASGLSRGAYHVYDLCEPADVQLLNIEKNVEVDPAALPLAIDVEFYPTGNDSNWHKHQMDCFKLSGAAKARSDIKSLLEAAQSHFKKRPVIFGNKDVFGQLLTEGFSNYSIWLHDYNSKTGGTELPGRNPWTMWQYTDKARVGGIAGFLDASVFFGTEAEFVTFKDTGQNISLESALAK